MDLRVFAAFMEKARAPAHVALPPDGYGQEIPRPTEREDEGVPGFVCRCPAPCRRGSGVLVGTSFREDVGDTHGAAFGAGAAASTPGVLLHVGA